MLAKRREQSLGLQMEAEKDRGSEDAKREAFGRLQPQPQPTGFQPVVV
jgi:hypothetical protein